MLISYHNLSATITVITRTLMTFTWFLSCEPPPPRGATSIILNMTTQNLEHDFKNPKVIASVNIKTTLNAMLRSCRSCAKRREQGLLLNLLTQSILQTFQRVLSTDVLALQTACSCPDSLLPEARERARERAEGPHTGIIQADEPLH